jgi:hypothetical protein
MSICSSLLFLPLPSMHTTPYIGYGVVRLGKKTRRKKSRGNKADKKNRKK